MDRAKVSGSGDAIATAPGAVAISGAGTVRLTGALPARSYYRDQIVQIAAQDLLDRDTELAELAAFCTVPDEDAPTYRSWRAPKWSGKTALMAAFALMPPPGVRVVAFFVTARWAGHDTRAAFVDIVGDQVAEILDEPSPTSLPPHVRDSYLTGLLTRAAEKCREQGERLVLLVDGLDEDRGTPHDQAGQGISIAAALPVRPSAGMRILVSGRPNPRLPGDVPADHPLRDPAVLRRLDVSPHAKVAEDRMLLELDRLLHGDAPERDLLGLLTAARGGLTAADLAELTGQSAGQVRRRLRGVAARTFDTRSGHWRHESEVYLLGHEDLHAIAVEDLGERQLSAYRQCLHDWAEHHRGLGWPPQTPEYLLRGYHRLLTDIDDLPRMIALATDPARHNRMLDLSGGDTTALTEIATTQNHVLLRAPADLLAMQRLAIHRDHLLTRNSDIPVTLPAHWARRGQVERAVVVANSITDPVTRCAAMGRVAATVAATGSPDQARSLIAQTELAARTIIEPSTRGRALVHVAAAVGAIGDLERAEAIARDITDPNQQVIALTYVAQAVTRTGDIERARSLVDDAEAIARDIIDTGGQSYVLMYVVDARVRVGDLEQAETIADAFDLGFGPEIWLLRQLVEAMADAGQWERAEAIARKITDPGDEAGVVARLATAVARSGDMERARSLTDHAEAIIRDLADVGERAEALADLASMVGQSGDVKRSRALIADIEAVMPDIIEPHRRMRTLKNMVTAITATGDLVRAETIARSITDPTERTLALEQLAIAYARAGDLDRAETIAHDFSDTSEWPHPRTRVAEAIADAGEPSRAETVARRIMSARRRDRVLGQVAQALAQAGDLERAESVARNDIAPSWRELPLAEIAVTQAQMGDLEHAEVIACDITNQDHKAWALGQVAAALAQAGNVERARKVLGQAETAASAITDLEYQAQIFTELAEVYDEIGDQHRVCSLIDHVATIAHDLSPDGRALMLAWVVEMLVQAGDLEQADSVADDITEPVSRRWVLPQLIDTFVQAGEWMRAQALIDDAEVTAHAINDPDDRAWALGQVAKAAAQAHDLERAGVLIDHAEDIAHDMAQPGVRDWLLEQVAEALVCVGDLERARSVASSISTASRQDNVLTEVAAAIAQEGELELATSVAHHIVDPDRQARAMLELAQSCPPPGNEATAIGISGEPTSRSRGTEATNPRWSLIAEALRLTEWEDCLEILTEVVPTAATAALHELDILGWRSAQANAPSHT